MTHTKKRKKAKEKSGELRTWDPELLKLEVVVNEKPRKNPNEVWSLEFTAQVTDHGCDKAFVIFYCYSTAGHNC